MDCKQMGQAMLTSNAYVRALSMSTYVRTVLTENYSPLGCFLTFRFPRRGAERSSSVLGRGVAQETQQ